MQRYVRVTTFVSLHLVNALTVEAIVHSDVLKYFLPLNK